MPTRCRSGRHPYSERRKLADGRTECTSCRTENRQGRGIMGTIEHTGWYDPLIDSERAERLRAWQDGLDAAISAIRQAEGFDGDERPWQTLGEYLRLPTRHPVPFRPTVARTPIQTRAYSRMSPATRRRQALAAEDVGRLVDAS